MGGDALPQIRQGWLATKRRCSLQRMRLGSLMVRMLLSILVRMGVGGGPNTLG